MSHHPKLRIRYGKYIPKCNAYVAWALVQRVPEISFQPPLRIGSLYTLLMVDPDAPYPMDPSEAFMLHWMIVNIDGSNKRARNIPVRYKPPTPPRDSPSHRYFFFLYSQRYKLCPNCLPRKRMHFDLDAFEKKNGLGDPIDWFMFRTKRD